MSEDIFKKCKDTLEKRLADIGVTPAVIMLIVRYAMEIVELTELKGNNQKQMVLRLVRSIVTESDLDDAKKNICIKMLDEGVVENAIDLIIDATKGRIFVNRDEIIDVAQSCCGIICPL